MSIDFNNSDYDFLHLHDVGARERHIQRIPLLINTQSLESRRGSSSHNQNPFIALLSKDSNN